MIEYEKLLKVNQELETVKLSKKDYVMVPERVKAFRKLCPGGTIETEVISSDGKSIVFKATVLDDSGRVLGQGHAYEKEGSSYINKTSYVENCETSAVGRALGFAGIGIDGSMASAEEVANAALNQNKGKSNGPNDKTKGGLDRAKFTAIINYLKREGYDERNVAKELKINSLDEMTSEQWNVWAEAHKGGKKDG